MKRIVLAAILLLFLNAHTAFAQKAAGNPNDQLKSILDSCKNSGQWPVSYDVFRMTWLSGKLNMPIRVVNPHSMCGGVFAPDLRSYLHCIGVEHDNKTRFGIEKAEILYKGAVADSVIIYETK